MSRAWLDIFLGRTGKYIVNFIVNYYYYLIPIIIIYGIFLTISSYNLKRIEKRVNLEIVNQAKDLLKKKPDIGFVNLLSDIKIPWEKIIGEISFFPFISGESDIWVIRATPVNVRKIILKDSEKVKKVLQRKSVIVSDEDKGVRKNLYLDYIHKISREDK